MSGVFLTIFTLFWTGMVLLFDGFMVHGLYKQCESQHFLVTTGTITHSELTSSRGSKGGTSYSAKLEYKYDVGGQVFTGDKIRFGMQSSSHVSAANLVSAHPVGSDVQIFYNPADAHESLLIPGVQGSDLMGFIFMTPFNMVMLGLWFWIGGWVREHWFKPVAGGVKIITDVATTRVRLPQFPALGWGIVTTGGLGFISIFIVGFSTNMEPSITLAVAVLAAIYVAGLGVFLWQRQKINSGIDDLIIDEASRSLELPLTFGRKERVLANVADIECLYVVKIEHRSNKGGISYTYAPTLCLRKTEKEFQKLADWSDKMRADDFTEWLRTKLGADIPATYITHIPQTKNEFEDAPQVPAAEIQRPENSKIKISDGPEGREFYFPAARNIGTTFVLTLVTALFDGIATVLFLFHAPIFFAVIFGLVGILMLYGTFNLWFRSVRITVNSTNVRVKKQWLVFSRTREFSAGDYVRFATKMGMQSGSTIFTDIRLVRAGADAEFTQDLKKSRDMQGVNQLVVERFRQAAGPSGVTVATNIANSAEAQWLVKEMSSAFGQVQLHPAQSPYEMAGGPTIDSGAAKARTATVLAFFVFLLVGSVGFVVWYHSNPISTKLAPSPKSIESKSATSQLAQSQPVLDVAFSSFGPGGEYATNGYLVGAEGYANSFVPKVSGPLKVVELKIEPAGQSAGRLAVFIKEDQGGFPERTLETFSIPNPPSTNSAGWIMMNSRQLTLLKAGTKYWLCARSPGTWLWHFSPQDLVQVAMHSPSPRAWAVVGSTNVCAFSVLTQRNSAPSQ